MRLTEILQDSNYKLTQFSQDKIDKLEDEIFTKESRGKEIPYIEFDKTILD